MGYDEAGGIQRSACSLANRGRESAATRRLRIFLTAATAFDCELSEGKFEDFFRAIAQAKSSNAQCGDARVGAIGPPIAPSDTLSFRQDGSVDLPAPALDGGPAALSDQQTSQ